MTRRRSIALPAALLAAFISGRLPWVSESVARSASRGALPTIARLARRVTIQLSNKTGLSCVEPGEERGS